MNTKRLIATLSAAILAAASLTACQSSSTENHIPLRQAGLDQAMSQVKETAESLTAGTGLTQADLSDEPGFGQPNVNVASCSTAKYSVQFDAQIIFKPRSQAEYEALRQKFSDVATSQGFQKLAAKGDKEATKNLNSFTLNKSYASIDLVTREQTGNDSYLMLSFDSPCYLVDFDIDRSLKLPITLPTQ